MGFLNLFGPDIGYMEKNKDVESLIACLKNDSLSVRKKACDALGRIGDKRAILPLINMLKEDEEKMKGDPKTLSYEFRELRSSIIYSLSKIYQLGKDDDPRIVKTLIDELNFPTPHYPELFEHLDSCLRAISGLAIMNNNDAKKALISIIYNPRYKKYEPLFQNFLKDTLQNPELLPYINDTYQKQTEVTKKAFCSRLSEILPDQKLKTFSIVTYTSAMAMTAMADKLIVSAAATAVLGPVGGIILGGGGTSEYKNGIIGFSDKEFFFIDFNYSLPSTNGYIEYPLYRTPKFIKRVPLKEVKVEYDENSGKFLVTGAINSQFVIGNFNNYANSQNAHLIVNAIKNA